MPIWKGLINYEVHIIKGAQLWLGPEPCWYTPTHFDIECPPTAGLYLICKNIVGIRNRSKMTVFKSKKKSKENTFTWDSTHRP